MVLEKKRTITNIPTVGIFKEKLSFHLNLNFVCIPNYYYYTKYSH